MMTKITHNLKLVLILALIFGIMGCKKNQFNSLSDNFQTNARNASENAQQIKIATYNVHLYLGVVLKDDKARQTAIQEYLHSTQNDNDIVFFQEIWKDVTKNEIANDLKDVYPFSYHTNSVSTTIGDGLLILSKIPIKENRFFPFKDSGGVDFFAPKGFLKTVFSTSNGDFIAFSTHANSDEGYANIRKKQFEQIKTELSNIADVPSIILGDLNVIGETTEYQEMLSIFNQYSDTFRTIFSDSNVHKGYTFDNEENLLTNYFYPKSSVLYRERLDYILTSKSGWQILNAEVKKDVKYNSNSLGNSVDCSDHYLYQATLVLTKNNRVEDSNIANNYNEAVEKINALKAQYGTGLTARIIIHNNTSKSIQFKNKTSWYNSTFYSTIPAEIPAGKFGVVLAAHDTGEATGVFNQISYQFENQLLSFGTYVPWSWVYTNNVLVGFEEISQENLERNSTRPSISKTQNSIKLDGETSTGDSPLIQFKVSEI